MSGDQPGRAGQDVPSPSSASASDAVGSHRSEAESRRLFRRPGKAAASAVTEPVADGNIGHRDGMPRWIPRAIFYVLAAVAGFMVCIWAFQQLRNLIILLVVSFFLALAIEPAVNRLASRGMRRGVATMIVFTVIFLAVVLFIGALGSLLVSQVISIAENFPDYVEGAIDWVNGTFNTELSSERVQQEITANYGAVQSYLTQLAGNALGVTLRLLGGVFSLFTVLLFTFYFSAQGPQFRRYVTSLFPPRRQREVLRAWEIAVDKTGGYIYSRGLMAVISFACSWLFFAILGIPYDFALAIWVGAVSQFIPTVGTYLAGALPILVALTQDPLDALWILLFIIAYQQFENYILQPRITAATVAVHPAVAFGSVVAGAALMGATGALLAIPVTASLQAFLGSYIRRYDVVGDDRSDLSLEEVQAEARKESRREMRRGRRLWRRSQSSERGDRDHADKLDEPAREADASVAATPPGASAEPRQQR